MPKPSEFVLEFWKGLKIESKMPAIRERMLTDHAFLAESLGYNDFEDAIHGEIWDFWLKKDHTLQPFKKFADMDTSSHERALFVPRSGFKSSARCVDDVQYIINWPDITILWIVGKDELGRDFMLELRGHFLKNDDDTLKDIDGKASLFQLAFPEFLIDSTSPKDVYTAPCRTNPNHREPTVKFAGVETSMSGPHYDVIRFDDPITNENSKTSTRLITIRNQIAYHRKMRHPYGYCDFIGTWYNIQDHYGFIIKAEQDNKTLFWNKGRADSRDVEQYQCLAHILLRPAMWPKEDKEIDISGSLEEKDWVLWFPHRLTWKWLMSERATNFELFMSQLMNNPNMSKTVRFNRMYMTRNTKPFTEMPDLRGGMGIIVQGWDTAYSDATLANYTVGVTCLILGGRYYWLDMIRGQFNDAEIAHVIAENIAKWRPARVAFEDAFGVRWLTHDIYRALDRMNFYAPIEFCEVTNKKNRKSIMAAPVAKLFSEDRIIISNGVPYLDTIYSELEGFQNGAPNDDIVDALSIVVHQFQYIPDASVTALRQDIDEELQTRKRFSLYKHIHNMNVGTFGFEGIQENVPADQIDSFVQYDPSSAWK